MLSRAFVCSAMLTCGVIVAGSIGCRPPTATVTGSVRLDGQSLEAGTVVFHATDDNYRETKGCYVDGGRYRIDGLPIKPMDIETSLKNSDTPLGERIRVELKPGEQVFDIDLQATQSQ